MRQSFQIQKKVEEVKEKFNNELEYFMSTLAYCAGFGSIWRFPYLIYKNGGGAFLIPYFFCFLVISIPLLYLEIALGQVYEKSPSQLYAHFGRKYIGLGYFSIFICLYIMEYYNCFMSYSLIYFYYSFFSPLPWSQGNSDVPEQDFFRHKVLQNTDRISDFGGINWQVYICYVVCMIATYICCAKGVKFSGKITIYTGSLPFLMLFILILRGLFLPGSFTGLVYLFSPDFSKIWNFQIWNEAISQCLFQFSIGNGVLILFGSFRSQSAPLLRQSIHIPLSVLLCGFLSSIAVFLYVGHLAYSLEIPLESLKLSGAELCFVVFPMALNILPWANLWAVLFFVMMLLLGIDTMFAFYEYTEIYKRSNLSRETFRLVLGLSFSLLGLLFCLGSGFQNIVFTDSYVGILLIFSALAQPVFFLWHRDFGEVTSLIYQHTGESMREDMVFVIKYMSTSVLAVLLLVSFPITVYENAGNPVLFQIFGFLVFVFLPFYFVYYYYKLHKDDSVFEDVDYLSFKA